MEDFHEHSPLGHRILHLAADSAVSDFYITPWEPLNYKYNGKLRFDSFVYQPRVPFQYGPGCEDYAMSVAGRRFRVSRMMTQGRPRWVMRLLPESIPDLERIMVPPASVKAFLEAKNGLFLVCGATGSGKSTTIASLVKARAERRQEHVITFEDPIEYLYPSGLPSLISQREMGSDEHDFVSSLRAALRQAPDVIVVGEIRDGQTAEIALQAAETGHVVVATLHTSSAAQTVQRFLKLVPSERVETAMLSFADSLRAILCQRLLLDETQGKRFPIHELLLQYDSVCALIRRGEFKKLDQELEVGQSKGMFSFEHSLEERQLQGFRPPAGSRATGFSAHEVKDYLEREFQLPG
jgi:twitching motility protein PilT